MKVFTGDQVGRQRVWSSFVTAKCLGRCSCLRVKIGLCIVCDGCQLVIAMYDEVISRFSLSGNHTNVIELGVDAFF